MYEKFSGRKNRSCNLLLLEICYKFVGGKPKIDNMNIRTVFRNLIIGSAALLFMGCDAMHTLTDSKRNTSQGGPYEVVTICHQPLWEGEVGGALRSILRAQDPYLNAEEPLFDLFQVTPRNVTKIVDDHRNQIIVKVDASVETAGAGVSYDVTASPQIVITLQGPSERAVAAYLQENGEALVQMLEKAERDRAIAYAKKFNEKFIQEQIEKTFGVQMTVPKGYVLAKQTEDFMWMRYEYPAASKGFMLYSRPYEGPASLSATAVERARLKFAAEIPGPSDGSYMTTSYVFPPIYRMLKIGDRYWAELRGFWDVENDFMGGPFVSYSTLDEESNRVITLDCYIYSPKLDKRNFMRDVEHLVYMINFEPKDKDKQ